MAETAKTHDRRVEELGKKVASQSLRSGDLIQRANEALEHSRELAERFRRRKYFFDAALKEKGRQSS